MPTDPIPRSPVADALTRSRLAIVPVAPDAAEARACLSAYFALLIDRVAGVTAADLPDPDPETDSYRPPQGAFLVALSDGLPLACVGLKSVDDTTGEVKRLWVAPEARGMGLARQMMAAIEDEARRLGKSSLRLDTNGALTEAIALYRATGWTDTQPFTDFPATHWFAKRL